MNHQSNVVEFHIFKLLIKIPGSLSRVSKEESFDITLKVLQCNVLTVSPIKVGPVTGFFHKTNNILDLSINSCIYTL